MGLARPFECSLGSSAGGHRRRDVAGRGACNPVRSHEGRDAQSRTANTLESPRPYHPATGRECAIRFPSVHACTLALKPWENARVTRPSVRTHTHACAVAPLDCGIAVLATYVPWGQANGPGVPARRLALDARSAAGVGRSRGDVRPVRGRAWSPWSWRTSRLRGPFAAAC